MEFGLTSVLMVAVLFCSILIITNSSRIQAIILLICCYILTAIVFYIYDKQFIAIMLTIVYAGAVAVFFLFVIMIFGPQPDNIIDSGQHHILYATMIIAILYTLIEFILLQ